jgi:hypothetical protein
MLVTRRAALSLAALALLPLSACKDSSGPDRTLVGKTQFTYSGAVTGEFDAEGRATATNFENGTFAFAQRGRTAEGKESLLLYAQEGRANSNLYDGLVLGIPQPGVGSVTCTATTPAAASSVFSYWARTTGRRPIPRACSRAATER